MDRTNNFNLIRLIAASQVMFAHATATIWKPVFIGQLLGAFNGVAVFFIISGFLISHSYMKSSSATDYAKRRFARIYPGLWFSLVVVLVAMYAAGSISTDATLASSWKWLVTLFVQGSDVVAGTVFHAPVVRGDFYHGFANGVLWTIPVEIGFYLLTPLIFAEWMVRRNLLPLSILTWGALSIACAILATALKSDTSVPSVLFRLSPFPFLWFFLIGAAIRLYWPSIRGLIEGKGFYLLPVYGAIFLVLGLKYNSIAVFVWWYFPVVVCLAIVVISCAYTARTLAEKLLGEVDISYGVYLYHIPVLYTLRGWGYGGWTAFSLTVIGTVIAASLSWFLIERPSIKWARSGRQTSTIPRSQPA